MLPRLIAGNEMGHSTLAWIDGAVLAIEILVAAGILRTVALEATLDSIVVLALLVLIRTFLSWALEVEIEGRWPWQSRREG